MSKNIPAIFPDIGPGEFMSGLKVETNDWQSAMESQHHQHQRRGAQTTIYISDGDPFETTSGSYTTIDDNDADNPLTLHQGVVRLTREMVDASAIKHSLTFVGVGKDIDVQVKVYAPDSGTTPLATFTASRASSTVDRFESSVLIAAAAADEDGVSGNDPRVLLVSIEVKANSTSAALYQAFVYESYITGAQLPTE